MPGSAEYKKRWAKENSDRIQAARDRWREKNPEKNAEIQRKARKAWRDKKALAELAAIKPTLEAKRRKVVQEFARSVELNGYVGKINVNRI